MIACDAVKAYFLPPKDYSFNFQNKQHNVS
jgi:hypothetical protein